MKFSELRLRFVGSVDAKFSACTRQFKLCLSNNRSSAAPTRVRGRESARQGEAIFFTDSAQLK